MPYVQYTFPAVSQAITTEFNESSAHERISRRMYSKFDSNQTMFMCMMILHYTPAMCECVLGKICMQATCTK